jgi:hypothetical protein
MLGAAVGLVFAAIGAACTPMATYPKIDGAVDWTGPKVEPVPRLMAEAIRYAWEHNGGEGEPAVNLPPGTPAPVYHVVIARIGAGHPLTDHNEPGYHVETVRVRGMSGEVDLVYPGAAGQNEYATFFLNRGITNNWHVTASRLWRIRITAPQPNYEAPPPMPEPTPAPEYDQAFGVEPTVQPPTE